MKSSQFLLFFSIVLIIYFSINFYIFKRSVILFQSNKTGKVIFSLLFIIISSSYFLYRVIERIYVHESLKVIGQIGSVWLAIMTYALILLLIYDFSYLILRYFIPKAYLYINSIHHLKWIISSAFISIILISLSIGMYNISHPVIRHYHLKSTKKIKEAYRVIFVSDLHINDLFYPQAVSKLVTMINEQSADLVLLGGDIFTEDVAHLKYHDTGALLGTIKSRFGIYTILGNHEYIGGIDSALNHFKSYGIPVLKDSSIIINNDLMIIGRDDLSGMRFLGRGRKPINALINENTESKYTILLDHQPMSYQEGKHTSIDLFLSGHTHHGQMYPFSMITQKLFDNSWGMQLNEHQAYYVSCGYGFLGPPIRTGSRSEIIVFHIEH